MLERRDFLLAERGADRDREMASGIQHNAAALVARLQATGTSGVRAALGGSPVAYGSLRAAKCILTRRDCDVNSLTRRGTKSRSGQPPASLPSQPPCLRSPSTDISSSARRRLLWRYGNPSAAFLDPTLMPYPG